MYLRCDSIGSDVPPQVGSDRLMLLKSFVGNIPFIEQTRTIKRARNDPHPNKEGYHAMAENIYDFLMENYKDELDSHRN